MKNYYDMSEGLNMMFWGYIGALGAAFLGSFFGITGIAFIALLGFSILMMIGMFKAGKDERLIKIAFVLKLVQIILSILENFGVEKLDLINPLLALVVDLLLVLGIKKAVTDIKAEGAAMLAKVVLGFGITAIVSSIIVIAGLALSPYHSAFIYMVCTAMAGISEYTQLAEVILLIILMRVSAKTLG